MILPRFPIPLLENLTPMMMMTVPIRLMGGDDGIRLLMVLTINTVLRLPSFPFPLPTTHCSTTPTVVSCR